MFSLHAHTHNRPQAQKTQFKSGVPSSTKIANVATHEPRDDFFSSKEKEIMDETKPKLPENYADLAQVLIRSAAGLSPERVPVLDEVFAYHVNRLEKNVGVAEIAWQRIDIPEGKLISFQQDMKKYGIRVNWIKESVK